MGFVMIKQRSHKIIYIYTHTDLKDNHEKDQQRLDRSIRVNFSLQGVELVFIET